jgi:hypothetical protein
MITYKLFSEMLPTKNSSFINKCIRNENCFIPFDPANTDYQAFKQDLANGVALSDAEGTAMTADQIKTFLETLP